MLTEVEPEELRLCRGYRRVLAYHGFDVAVEVIDGRVLCLECPLQADFKRYVARQAHAGPLSCGEQRIEDLAVDARMDLQEVVSRGLLFRHHTSGGPWRGDAGSVE